jgi:hypothetical protein
MPNVKKPPAKTKPRLTRWERLARAMRRRWLTSMEQMHAIWGCPGCTTISKVRDEIRRGGLLLEKRTRKGTRLTEWRVA